MGIRRRMTGRDVTRDIAAAYYPETNALVPLDHVAARANTPVSKAVVIRVEAVGHG
jgi:hypothetical protein